MIKTFVCNLKRCEDRRQYVTNNYPKSFALFPSHTLYIYTCFYSVKKKKIDQFYSSLT